MSEYCRHARLEDYGVTSTLSGSNHYGIVAHYTLRAVEQGLIVSYLLHLCTFDLINSLPGVTTIHCQAVYGYDGLLYTCHPAGDLCH